MDIDIKDPSIFRLYYQESHRNSVRVTRPLTSEERADARAYASGQHMYWRRPVDDRSRDRLVGGPLHLASM